MKRVFLILLLVAGVVAASVGGSGAARTSDLSYLYLKVEGVGGGVAANPAGRLIDPGCPDGVCVYEFTTGTQVMLSPITYGGGNWVSWYTVPGLPAPPCGHVVACSFVVTGKLGLRAQFSPVQLRVSAGVGGWVETETPGIACGNGCRRYAYGTTGVSVRAHAQDGYSFRSWYGGCAGIGEGCALSAMTRNRSLSASFNCLMDVCQTQDPITHDVPVTVTVRGPGSVSFRGIVCRTRCSKTAPEMSLVSLAAQANPGASVAGWSGNVNCGSGPATGCSFPAFYDRYGRGPKLTIEFR